MTPTDALRPLEDARSDIFVEVDASPVDAEILVDVAPPVDAALPIDAEPPVDSASPVDAAREDAGEEPGAPLHVRIMAANITSGNYQAYQGPGIRIIQGLDPDIVLIQEFNYNDNTDADIRALVREARGAEFSYYREPEGSIPNGIISRWPITLAGSENDPEVNNRNFAWARIDLPGHRDLWAFSLHLLTRNASTRNAEGQALVRFIAERVPEEDFLVIGGDFNTDNPNEDVLSTLRAVVTTAHTPVDHEGTRGTNANRGKPYDWVLADEDLNAFHVPVEIGARRFDHGLVFDTRVYTPLSDVSPAEYGDSAASNMQHMAVIKDFELR